jgi:hypothetical protein
MVSDSGNDKQPILATPYRPFLPCDSEAAIRERLLAIVSYLSLLQESNASQSVDPSRCLLTFHAKRLRLLVAQSRHLDCAEGCPLLGVKMG